MSKLTLVFAIIFAVCVSFAKTEDPSFDSYQRACGYLLPAGNFKGAVSAVVAGVANPVVDLLKCIDLVGLLNGNETGLQATLQAALDLNVDIFSQNANWCGCADNNARILDKLQVKADAEASLFLGAIVRARDINRGNMFAKILASAKAEADLTLAVDKFRATVDFKAFVKAKLGAVAYNLLTLGSLTDCLGITLATTDMTNGGLNLDINKLLLGVKARAEVLAVVAPKLTAEAFAAVYARKAELKVGANVLARISADLVADARLHLFEKLNRKVHKIADLVACFGDEVNATVAGTLRFNVVKRLYDLLDDAFDRKLEVDLIDLVNIVANVELGHVDFSVRVQAVAGVDINAIGVKLVAFLKGFIHAYSHPASIEIITNAKATIGNFWDVKLRAKAAVAVAVGAAVDIRAIVLDVIPKLDITPENCPDDKNNAEFKDCFDSKYNVAPSAAVAASAQVEASLTAVVDVIAQAKIDLKAKLDALAALPVFDFTKIDAQIKGYTAAAFDLVNLRAKVGVAVGQVKAAHLQLIAKVKADLADQLIAAKNADVLALNVKLQLLASVAALNGTNRAGCGQTLPDWTSDLFGADDCYALAKFPACQPLALVFAQIHLLKVQLLTAVSVKAAVAAKLEILKAKVAELELGFKAYADALVTTALNVKASAAVLVNVVAEATFKARVEVCVKVVTNGILSTCSYVVANVGANVNVKTHTLNAEFNAQAVVGLSADVLADRLNAALQICLSANIGGDLSYFKECPKTTMVTKRGIQAGSTSTVQSDFSDQSTSGSTGSQAGTTTGAGSSTGSVVGPASSVGAISFSVVSFVIMFVMALL